jgi:hypothetical protein
MSLLYVKENITIAVHEHVVPTGLDWSQAMGGPMAPTDIDVNFYEAAIGQSLLYFNCYRLTYIVSTKTLTNTLLGPRG